MRSYLVKHNSLGEWSAVTWFDVELNLLALHQSLATIALNL
jgi:hypothetical protein